MDIITRDEAINIGQAWYFDGVPCASGHIDKKNVKRWGCFECSRIRKKGYLEKDGDKIRAQKRESYRRNFEKIAEKVKIKYEEIREERKAYLKEYYKKNREKMIKRATEYSLTEFGKAVKKNTSNRRRTQQKLGDVDTKQLLALQKNAKRCYWCNGSLKKTDIHIDHYTPLSKGGEHTMSNLVISYSKCNLSKSAQDPTNFANSLGKLL